MRFDHLFVLSPDALHDYLSHILCAEGCGAADDFKSVSSVS